MIKKILIKTNPSDSQPFVLDSSNIVNKSGTKGTVNLKQAHLMAATPASDDEVATKYYVDQVASGGVNTNNPGSILPPVAISPNNESIATSQTVFTATPYRNAYEDNKRKERVFEIKKLDEAWGDETVIRYNINQDNLTLDESHKLSNNTSYEWRCMDVSEWGYTSQWSNVQEFRTGKEYFVVTPSISVSKPISETPTLKGTAFAVSTGTDQHVATSWRIIDQAGETVWESLNDAHNLVEITVPAKILQKNVLYTFMVKYHAETYDSSDWATVNGTTESDFGNVITPEITIAGYPDAINVNPVLSGNEFAVTQGTDTHVATDWILYDISQSNVIWSSTNDSVNLTNIKVNETLEPETQYVLNVRYKGDRCGWSDVASITFTTGVDVSEPLPAPNVTISDANDNVRSRFSAFNDFNLKAQSVDWILKQADLIVWSSLSDTINLTSCLVDYDLTPGASYTLEVKCYTDDRVSAVGQLKFTASSDQEEYLHFKVEPGTAINFASMYSIANVSQWKSFEDEYKVYIDDQETDHKFLTSASITVPKGDVKVKRLNTLDKTFPIFRASANVVEICRPLPKMRYNTTSDVTISFAFFNGCSKLQKVYPAAYRNVIHTTINNISSAFYNCSALTNLGKGQFTFCKNDVVNVSSAFYNLGAIDIDEYVFADFAKATTFTGCFQSARIKTVPNNIFKDCVAATTFTSCFYSSHVVTVPDGIFTNTQITNANSCFSACDKLTKVGALFKDSTVASATSCFYNCALLSSLGNVFENCSSLGDIEYCFQSCSSLNNIEGDVFKNCTSLTKIRYAFQSCANLTKISGNVFEGCTSIEPYTTTEVGEFNYPFYSCSKLSEISGAVFKNCTKIKREQNLFSGTNITKISGNVFEGCTALDSVPVYSRSQLLRYVKEISGAIFKGCTALSSAGSIFSGDDNLISITGNIFEGSGITSAVDCFYNCKNLQTVNCQPFKDCTKLVNINDVLNYSSSLVNIHNEIFAGLTALTAASNVFATDLITDIKGAWFKGCSELNTSSVFGNQNAVTRISGNVFEGCSAYKVASTEILPKYNLVTEVVGQPFKNTGYTSIASFFSGWSSLTHVGEGIFEGCNITDASSVFSGNKSIVEVDDFLKGCKNVSNMASCFSSCSALSRISDQIFQNHKLSSIDSVFSNCDALVDIPERLFANITTSCDCDSIFNACDGIKTIPANIFENSSGINSLSYAFAGTAINTIPLGLFSGCTNLSNAQYCFNGCTSLQTVGDQTFSGCTNLSNASDCFNGCTSLQTVGDQTFSGCTNLSNASYCFNGCTSLQTVGDQTFSGCTNLSNAQYCFNGCTSLQTVGDQTFSGCTNLSNASYCFNNCSAFSAIPSKTFESCSSLSSLRYGFYNTHITALPATLFKDCGKLADLYYTFGACQYLETLPKDIFLSTPNITTLERCFYNTGELTLHEDLFKPLQNCNDFERCFQSSRITSIPARMFVNVPLNTDVRYCFANCNGIRELDTNVFEDSNISNASYCFADCSFETISADVFKNCSKCSNFTYAFSGNRSLKLISGNVFENCLNGNFTYWIYDCSKITEISGAVFKNTNITYNQQNIWHYTPDVISGNIFENCLSLSTTNDEYWYNYFPKAKRITGAIFKGCSNLTDLQYAIKDNSRLVELGNTFEGVTRNQYWNTKVVYNCPNLELLSGALYKDSNISVLGCISNTAKIKAITGNLYENCHSLTSADNWYSNWGNRAKFETISGAVFKNCINLTSAVYCIYDFDLLEDVAGNIFEGCTKLNNAKDAISNCDNLVRISGNIFEGCKSLDNSTSYPHLVSLNKLTEISGSMYKDSNGTLNVSACPNLSIISGALYDNAPNGKLNIASITQINKDVFINNESRTSGPSFDNCQIETLPEGILDHMPNITSAPSFYKCFKLKTIPTSLFKKTPKINRIPNFGYCMSLEEIPEGFFAGLSSATSGSSSFSWCTNLKSIGPGAFKNCSLLNDVSSMFDSCTQLETISDDIFAGCIGIKNTTSLFKKCSSLKSIPATLLNDATALINVSNMFETSGVTTIDEGFLAKNVNIQNASSMFKGCRSLEQVHDTFTSTNVKISNINSIFESCSRLASVPLALFKAKPALTSASSCFDGAGIKTITPSIFEGVSSITSLSSIFRNCNLISHVPDGLFNGLVNITSLSNIFTGCLGLVTVGKNLINKCTKLNSFYAVFDGCTALCTVGDIFKGNTSVTDTSYCFRGNSSLTSVPKILLAELVNLTNATYMFASSAYRPDLTINAPNVTDANYFAYSSLNQITGNVFVKDGTKTADTFLNASGKNYNVIIMKDVE